MAHILIVDDEDGVRSLIKTALAMHNHTCDMAVNGVEALELIRKHRYDLMIIDHYMPQMTGIQTVMILRSNAAYKHIKVLMCTSASLMNEVEDAFKAGVNDYILKPINLQQLADKVKRLTKKVTP